MSRLVFTSVLLGLMMLIFSATFVGYQIGINEVHHALYNINAQQKDNKKAAYSQAHIDALSSILGKMQAQLIRIEALGLRLVEDEGIDKEEFDFSKPPALGGVTTESQNMTLLALKKEIKQFARLLTHREQQMFTLDKIIMQHHLYDSLIPAGRPVSGGWISSAFGYRTHPISGKREFHKGIDFAWKKGSLIEAVASGVVVFSGRKGGYGNVVDIKHGDGFITRYAHNQKNLVKKNTWIAKGQSIALMGSTGRSTGVHLHFEVFKKDKRINPIRYVNYP